jgi:DNA phosphorothioation-dependent restriction protein DptG
MQGSFGCEGWKNVSKKKDPMAEVLAVDRATFHRYRSGFIYGVAERLGWW